MRSASFILTGVVFLLMALGALDHAAALTQSREPLLHRGLALLSSPLYTHGSGTLFGHSDSLYRANLGAMRAHMGCGAVALLLGTFQFVPALRRRAPHWHRLAGSLVILATAASLAAAVAFLAAVAPAEAAPGAVFHLRQCALTGLTAFALLQALLALLARDFRSHMVWMATVYAGLAATPLLHLVWLAWVPIGRPDLTSITLAASSGTLLMAQLLMTAWLACAGDLDLPARLAVPVPSRWPRPLLRLLGGLTIASVLAYVAQVIGGPDPLAGWRVATRSLPPGDAALVWAAGCLLLSTRFLGHWDDVLAGDPLDAGGLAGALLTGAGALALGLLQPLGGAATWALAAFWTWYGASVLLLLALSQSRPPNSLGRNGWGLFLLFLVLVPSQVPGWLALCAWLDLRLDDALAASLVIGLGVLGTGAMATAYGARVRLVARRSGARPAGGDRRLRRAARA